MLKIGDFWEKWQAYSLIFRSKLAVLAQSLIFGGRWRKLKIGDFLDKLHSITILFGEFSFSFLCLLKCD